MPLIQLTAAMEFHRLGDCDAPGMGLGVHIHFGRIIFHRCRYASRSVEVLLRQLGLEGSLAVRRGDGSGLLLLLGHARCSPQAVGGDHHLRGGSNS